MTHGHQVLMCSHLASGEDVHSPVVAGYTQQAAVAVKVDTEDVCWLRSSRINNRYIRSTPLKPSWYWVDLIRLMCTGLIWSRQFCKFRLTSWARWGWTQRPCQRLWLGCPWCWQWPLWCPGNDHDMIVITEMERMTLTWTLSWMMERAESWAGISRGGESADWRSTSWSCPTWGERWLSL